MSHAARLVANRVAAAYDMPHLPAQPAVGPRRVCCCCLLLLVAALAFVPSALILSNAAVNTPTTPETPASRAAAAAAAAAATATAASTAPLGNGDSGGGSASEPALEAPRAASQLERAALRLRRPAGATAGQRDGGVSDAMLGARALRESNPEWSAGARATTTTTTTVTDELVIDVAHVVGWLVNRARAQR